MNYWRGRMSWPLDAGWSCPICGYRGLTWGLIHGECRCDQCHAIFGMRENGQPVSAPVCYIKEEYFGAAQEAWRTFRAPLDELTPEQWSQAGAP
jgi:hypothetical protein